MKSYFVFMADTRDSMPVHHKTNVIQPSLMRCDNAIWFFMETCTSFSNCLLSLWKDAWPALHWVIVLPRGVVRSQMLLHKHRRQETRDHIINTTKQQHKHNHPLRSSMQFACIIYHRHTKTTTTNTKNYIDVGARNFGRHCRHNYTSAYFTFT